MQRSLLLLASYSCDVRFWKHPFIPARVRVHCRQTTEGPKARERTTSSPVVGYAVTVTDGTATPRLTPGPRYIFDLFVGNAPILNLPMVGSNSPLSPTRFGGQSFAGPSMAMNKVTKLFEGSRNLWRQRFLVDIAIFQHEKVVMMKDDQPVHNPFCIEVIIFNPSIGAEAPHLYLSYNRLCKKFKRSGTFLTTGTEDLIVAFVLNRVGVVTPTDNCSDQEYSFDVMLMPLEDDAGTFYYRDTSFLPSSCATLSLSSRISIPLPPPNHSSMYSLLFFFLSS